MFGTHDYSMVENTVLLSHNGIITEKFCNTSSSKYTDLTIQDISKTPTLSENEIISRLLIKESFGNTNLPRELQMFLQICGEQPPKVITNQFSRNGLFMEFHGTRIPALEI